MKKITYMILALSLILTACAPSAQPAEDALPPQNGETQPQQFPAEQSTVQEADQNLGEKVQAMQPVLDSIVRTMGIESETVYSPNDPEFFWSVLYLTGANWWGALRSAEVNEADFSITVPRQSMQKAASAAFPDCGDLLPIPEGFDSLRYDKALDAYVLTASDPGDTYTMIESVEPADGAVTANVGLYVGGGERLGGVVFTLRENPCAQGIDGPVFLYSVESAANEADLGLSPWQEMSPDQEVKIKDSGNTVTANITSSEGGNITVSFAGHGGNFSDEIPPLEDISVYLGNTFLEDDCTELYLCGDAGSNDYVTCIYRVSDGELKKTTINGRAISADGRGTVMVTENIDILGTSAATCAYSLGIGEEFAFMRAGDYMIVPSDAAWEYSVLTLSRDGLPLEWSDGTKAEGKKGDKFLLNRTDLESFVQLITPDGRLCRAAVESRADEDSFSQWFIGGRPEADWFDELNYAG